MAAKRNDSSGFVHLHVRSAHSHLYGASRLEELLETARGLGYHELALTDRNGLYGSIAFYQKAREAGLKPILGVELVHASGRAVCLARGLEGYRTICRLTSARHLNPDFDLAEAVAADPGDIYVLVPDAELLAKLDRHVPAGRLLALLEEFGDRSTRLRNDGLARSATQRGLPLAGSGAVAMHAPGRWEAHRTLRAIATLSTVADVPRRELAHPKAYLKGPGEMAALFRPYPEAVANTIRIAADCNLELPLGRPIFPKAKVPEGETAYSHLAKLAFAGLKRRYRPLRPEAVRRLERELATIDRLGFADYFLILHGIVSWTRGRGVPVVARGSAAGSLVTYALGISAVDPLAYDLLFERFLNLERPDCPDIDLDIAWESRDDVIDHIYETYGNGRVAMISTHQTFQAKSAFREVAKAHGLPPGEVDRLSARLPYYAATGIRDAVLSFPELRDFPVGRADIARILEIASALDSLPRHLSVHVGGLVISDRPLTDYLPLQVAAKGLVIAQYEAEAVEAMGLVKMDLLAQRSLSILQTAVRQIEKNHGLRIDPDAIQDGDAAAAEILSRGDTFGCFQIESPGMRNLLKRMGARRRLDVILGLSLIRPGPASSGMKDRFVRRRRGLEPPEHLHPALKDVLGDTYGVMLYQEDVIRVAHAAAGFTLAEGDRLRRVLSKGAAPSELGAWRTRFIRGALASGARREDAETLWERVANFAAYSYCKAHACTYGEISYRSVYLRAHYPAEFAAAVLANQAGYYERRTYLEDARRRGCPILGPDVNASAVQPSTEWVEPFAGGLARRVALRLGLMDVRGLSERAMRDLVASRAAGGPYASVADLLGRVRLSRQEAENLALSGAFDSLGLTRPQALWQVHTFSPAACQTRPLLGEQGPRPDPPSCPDLPDYSPLEKLKIEEHVLGMTPSANPMAVYREANADCGLRIAELTTTNGEMSHDARKNSEAGRPLPSIPHSAFRIPHSLVARTVDLPHFGGKEVAVAGVLFAERRARTKTGEFMKFLSLEDEWGVVEAVLLPEAYQRLGARITTRGPYLVTGTVEDHLGAISLIVTDLGLIAIREYPAAPAAGPQAAGPKTVTPSKQFALLAGRELVRGGD